MIESTKGNSIKCPDCIEGHLKLKGDKIRCVCGSTYYDSVKLNLKIQRLFD